MLTPATMLRIARSEWQLHNTLSGAAKEHNTSELGDMSGPDILAFAQELEVHHQWPWVIAKQIIDIAMIGQRNPQTDQARRIATKPGSKRFVIGWPFGYNSVVC
jgi:hypothetical protein